MCEARFAPFGDWRAGGELSKPFFPSWPSPRLGPKIRAFSPLGSATTAGPSHKNKLGRSAPRLPGTAFAFSAPARSCRNANGLRIHWPASLPTSSAAIHHHSLPALCQENEASFPFLTIEPRRGFARLFSAASTNYWWNCIILQEADPATFRSAGSTNLSIPGRRSRVIPGPPTMI